MGIEPTDIIMRLSGGSQNKSPENSLGGEFSQNLVNATTLFSNLTESEALAGRTDYRCIYLFNENAIYSLSDAVIGITSQVGGGASVEIGVISRNEKQKIVVNGTADSGYFVLEYALTNAGLGTHRITVNYDSDIDIWASNLQTALNACPEYGFTGCKVTVSKVTISSGDVVTFVLDWTGTGAKRYFNLLTCVENRLGGDPEILISRIQAGAPINAIAPVINSETDNPSSVTFTSNGESIGIGTLTPYDSFSIWIKRIIIKNTTIVQNDGFVLKLTGT